MKINSENLDKKEKLLSSHLSSVKDTKKKDKTRQSSSGGSAPGTPVPGERGSTSGGSALTPGELKVNFKHNTLLCTGTNVVLVPRQI